MTIFQIQNGQVVINENILLIPYLRVIHDKYPTDRIKVFAYIHYSTLPANLNIYTNIHEELREGRLRKDFPGFDHDDPDVQHAIKRLKEKYYTAVDRLMDNARKSVEVLSDKIVDVTRTAMDGSAKEVKAALDVLRGLSELSDVLTHLDAAQKSQTNTPKRRIAYDQT
jgi:hypothetical protein